MLIYLMESLSSDFFENRSLRVYDIHVCPTCLISVNHDVRLHDTMARFLNFIFFKHFVPYLAKFGKIYCYLLVVVQESIQS